MSLSVPSQSKIPVRMSSSPAISCLLFLSQLRLSPTLLSPYDLMMIWYLFLWPMPRITAIPSSSQFYATSSLLPSGRSPLGGPLWEVGGSLLFSLVHSPHPSSLALETFPEEQDFLWRYQHTLICQTCRDMNCRPSSLANNSNFSLFGPPWWYSGISHFLLLFLILVISQLQWSPVIISC